MIGLRPLKYYLKKISVLIVSYLLSICIGVVKTYGKERVVCNSIAYARSITAIENKFHCSDKCVRRYFSDIKYGRLPCGSISVNVTGLFT